MDERFSALQIEYSSACNMETVCTHCYGATGVLTAPRTIPHKMFEMILEEAKYIAQSITITGGEPAVFPEIVRRICDQSGLPVLIMTNGLSFIERVKPAGILFSLDAKDVRPIKNVDQILENVLRYECNVACNTVLSEQLDLFEYYEKVVRLHKALLSKGKKLTEWKLGFVIAKGKACSNEGIFPDLETVFLNLREFIVRYFKEQPFPLAIRGMLYTRFMEQAHLTSVPRFQLNPHRNPCLDCYGRGEILTVNAEGKVQLCTVCRDVSVAIGESLIDAVDSLLERKELSHYTYADWKDCHDCRFKHICGCGCPSLAETYGSTWTGKDPLQCSIMEYWERYILPILPHELRSAYYQAIRGT